MGRSAAVISKAIRHGGLATAVRHLVAKHRVSILLYHDPQPETLAEHLQYLQQRYSGVRLSHVVEAIESGTWSELPAFPLVVTFDDGWKGNVFAAEMCAEAGFPPTIFVCSQIVGTSRHYWWTETGEAESLKSLPVERRLAQLTAGGFSQAHEYPDRQALSQAEIRRIRQHAEFGAHTRFHPILTTCTTHEAWDEINGCRDEVTRLAEHPCRHFAYPNGDYTEREVNLVKRAGFSSARTLDVGWNTATTDLYRLKCLGSPDDASVDRLAADLAGAAFIWRWLGTGRRNGRRSLVRSADPVEVSAAEMPIVDV